MFHLAGFSGLRSGELSGLHVEDIDFVRGVVRVRRSVWRGLEVSTKTKKGYRDVFIDLATAQMLKEYLGDRSTGRVFQTKNGTPLENHNIVREVAQADLQTAWHLRRAVCMHSVMAASVIFRPATSQVISQKIRWDTQACGRQAVTRTSQSNLSVILWRDLVAVVHKLFECAQR